MAAGYLIVPRKLQELESQVNALFSLPPHTPYHELERYALDIEQKLDFFKTLFSIEMASSPKKPQHLEHIGKKLSDLETAFHGWYEFRTTTHECTKEVSTCLCTESYHGDDDVDPLCLQDQRNNVIEEGEGESEEVRAEEKKEIDEKWSVGVGWVCGSVGGGIVIGMALMSFVVVRCCGCFPYGQTATTMCLTLNPT